VSRDYQQDQRLRPAPEESWQWPAAWKAGLAAGIVFLLVARGNPWAGLTLSSPVVMGRVLPASFGIALPLAWLLHIVVSVLYGVIISLAVVRLTQWRAIVMGGVVGVALYGANWAFVHFFIPELQGAEPGVLLTHFGFGLVAAGAYRGLLRRQQPALT